MLTVCSPPNSLERGQDSCETDQLLYQDAASEGDQHARVPFHVHPGTHDTPGKAFLEIVVQDLCVLSDEVRRMVLHESGNQRLSLFLQGLNGSLHEDQLGPSETGTVCLESLVSSGIHQTD